MCDPVSIAVITASVAAAGVGLAAKGQMEASEANRQGANLTAGQAQYDLNVRSSQVDAQQSENTVQSMIDAAAQRGAISASASSMGASVGQLTRNQNAADFAMGRSLSISALNSQNQRRQASSEEVAIGARKQSVINSVQKPSAIGIGLGMADAALKGAGAYTSAGGQLPGSGTKQRAITTGPGPDYGA